MGISKHQHAEEIEEINKTTKKKDFGIHKRSARVTQIHEKKLEIISLSSQCRGSIKMSILVGSFSLRK